MKKSSAAQVFGVERFMTASPHAIGPNATLAEALRAMRELADQGASADAA